MQLTLPPELAQIIEKAVRSGRYADPLEAARAAFMLLNERDAEFEALRREIEIGIASPKEPWEPDLLEDIRRRGRERLARERGAA